MEDQAAGTTSAHAENTGNLADREHARGNYLRARGEYRRAVAGLAKMLELPPRTRRILGGWCGERAFGGTTSAHAENTSPSMKMSTSTWNYLRARGEYITCSCFVLSTTELPPRTRRILQVEKILLLPLGTTSAHAENTDTLLGHKEYSGNYLRARGEYIGVDPQGRPKGELPPRTRRILHRIIELLFKCGTTSAHAENTTPSTPPGTATGELPPRTRRIQAALKTALDVSGTTSAHAENTLGFALEMLFFGNYLRARGEYPYFKVSDGHITELPPRTRRIRRVFNHYVRQPGTTSAHAENTWWWRNCLVVPGNYLRARGEYKRKKRRCRRRGELPPRTRRIPSAQTISGVQTRTTSAHAENTLNELGLL